MSQLQIRDDNGTGIAEANVRISMDGQPNDAAIFDFRVDEAGNFTWPIPFWPNQHFTLHVNQREANGNALKHNPAFEAKSQGVGPGGDDIVVVLARVASPVHVADLSPLHIDGPLFRLASNNQPWHWKLVTAFDAFRLFLNGDLDKLITYAQWTRDVGGNGWRVFGGWSRTGLDFRNIGLRYFDELGLFCQWVAGEGLRMELACVIDSIPPDHQGDFLNLCADVLEDHTHVFMEYANEPWKNGLDPMAFNVGRTGLLTARGSAAPDAPPYASVGYTTQHPPRTEDWARKCGKDSYEIRQLTHDVVIPDEPIGFAETMKNARTNNAVHAFSAGVGAGLFCPGITAHGDSNTMQMCNVPGPQESACVREMFRGLDLVPLDAPSWRYARYGPSNPGVLMPIEDDLGPGRLTDHMHAMVGPNQAVVCNYYPSAGWSAVGANGWHVVKQDGSFVLCEH